MAIKSVASSCVFNGSTKWWRRVASSGVMWRHVTSCASMRHVSLSLIFIYI